MVAAARRDSESDVVGMIPIELAQPHVEVNENNRATNHPGYGVTDCWFCGRENIHVVGRSRKECIGVHLAPKEKKD